MIYLDNAATSFPKPPPVREAIAHFLTNVGASPGRSGHSLSIQAGRIVYQTREALATLFNVEDPLRIVFGPNVTAALNLTLRGLLRPGDHVITSAMEHNSVMRPLRLLESDGVQVSVIPCSGQGFLHPLDVKRACRQHTPMIVLNHASNVTGTLLPVAEVGRLAKERGLLLLVDAAQTAGALSIDMQNENIDLLAFTGHKGLLGPTGTGGLCVGPEVPVEQFRPLVQGGTGSNSELEEQPGFLPDKFESGTLNAAGLAGLDAGVRFLLDRGVAQIRKREMQLTRALLGGLSSTVGVTVYGPLDASLQTGTVAFNLSGIESSEVALRLDEVYGIMCRPGLHCAPAAHKTIGTYPGGTVRFSLGFFSTAGEVAEACAAVRALASEKQR